MGLLQNGYRHNLTGRMLGATSIDGANPYVHIYQGHIAARNRNILTGLTDNKAAVPNGNLAPSAWILPRKIGNMSSRSCSIDFTASANGLMGLPGVGSASFAFVSSADILPLDDTSPLRTASATFSFLTEATGGLIASGIGTASFAITTNNPDMYGVASGIGSASFAMTGEGNIGAIADIFGESIFSFDGIATAYPLNDSSPLRMADASFSFSGSLSPYAVGNMVGTTDVSTELTANSIISAVLGATASEWNEAGTIGNKINTASSGGVDLDALADAVWDKTVEAGTSAEEMLRILASVLAGKVSGAGTGTETFKGIDGTTSRVVSTVDDDGNRTEVVINAA